ncbi:MAG: poly-gamma-glutamate biosynthesis protein, partial [Desulfobacterales bacterium]|nr:poly-gamma-glutamate biosynthesis protein [Desulfobacterales bacterium]
DPSTGKLGQLKMIPTQMRRFRVNRASSEATLWLKDTLNREGVRFGTRVILDKENALLMRWD